MQAIAKPCPVGARGVDSYPFSLEGETKKALSAEQAATLKATGIDFVALYLGVADAALNETCIEAGLMTYGVTLGSAIFHPDAGKAAAEQMKALGMPEGTSCFLDVEGPNVYGMQPAVLVSKINAWADAVAAAGYVPGIYVGSPQPMSTDELTHLHVVRYWRAPSRVVDKAGHLAEPAPGWCAMQAWPSVMWPSKEMHPDVPDDHRIFVDVDFVYQDFHGRVPPMAVKA